MEPSLPPSDIFPAYLFVMLWGLGDEDVGSLWRHTEGARRGSKGRSIFLLFPPCIQMSNYQDPAPTLTRTHQGIYSYTHYILLLLVSPSVRPSVCVLPHLTCTHTRDGHAPYFADVNRCAYPHILANIHAYLRIIRIILHLSHLHVHP